MIPANVARSKSYLINCHFVTFYIPGEDQRKLMCIVGGWPLQKKFVAGKWDSMRKAKTELYLHDNRIRAIVFYNMAIDQENKNNDWDWIEEYKLNEKVFYGTTGTRSGQTQKEDEKEAGETTVESNGSHGW